MVHKVLSGDFAKVLKVLKRGMIYWDVRDIDDTLKNSVDHQFIEMRRFNACHLDGASEVFVDGQIVNNFSDQ